LSEKEQIFLEDRIDNSVSVESEYGKHFVEIIVPYSKIDNVLLPCENSETVARFIYKKKTIQDEKDIEKLSFIISQEENKIDNSTICVHLYRRLTLRKCLFSIDDWLLNRNNGWIVKQDWDKVKKLSAPIVNSSLMLFDILTSLSEEEYDLIERQAVGLFASQSGSVLNPHPVVSSYCSLSSLWEKLGIDQAGIDRVLNKDFLGFRMITGAESDAMRRAMQAK
jgi:hypothetical protein